MYYFKIHALESGKVLDASMSNEGEVVLWEMNGQENQLWFWDGPEKDVLRNKAFPHLALDFHWDDYENTEDQWGKIYLNEYTENWNQRWEIDGNELICKGSPHEPVDGLRMDIWHNSSEDGAIVGVHQQNGTPAQWWGVHGHYFHIMGDASGKVLDASMSNEGEVVLWELNGQDNQLWYWSGEHGDVLMNKAYPDRALDFHWDDFENSDDRWGKIYLNEECTDLWNQRWEFAGHEIICKGSPHEPMDGLRMDIFQNQSDDGTKVGVYMQNGDENQRWRQQNA